MVLELRDDGDELPAAIMPLPPSYDMEGKGETLDTRAHVDVLVQREILRGMAGMFLGTGSAADPLADPLYADPSGLPPMYIQVGDHECLLDDSHRSRGRSPTCRGMDPSAPPPGTRRTSPQVGAVTFR